MRRRSLAAAGILLAGAVAAGPLGVAAGPPYVYGCTPLAITGYAAVGTDSLTIYNGSATTASLIHKILSGEGAILNQADPNAAFALPLTSSLPATHTSRVGWLNDGSGLSVRVVSNVPVSVAIGIYASAPALSTVVCLPLQP